MDDNEITFREAFLIRGKTGDFGLAELHIVRKDKKKITAEELETIMMELVNKFDDEGYSVGGNFGLITNKSLLDSSDLDDIRDNIINFPGVE